MAIPQSLRDKIANAKKAHSSGGNWLSLDAGKPVTLRVLPGDWGSEGLFYHLIGIHYLGDESVNCPKINHDTHCPVCSHLDEVKDSLSAMNAELDDLRRQKASKEEIETKENEVAQVEKYCDDLRPSKKYLMNIVIRGENKAKVFTAPWGIFKTVFETFTANVESDGIDILDPMCGFSFTFKKEGSGQTGTKYSAEVLLKPSPLATDSAGNADTEAIAEILKSAHNLNERARVDMGEFDKAWNKFQGTAPSEKASPPRQETQRHISRVDTGHSNATDSAAKASEVAQSEQPTSSAGNLAALLKRKTNLTGQPQ